MTKSVSIHTLNARGNVMLEVIQEHYNLPPKSMRAFIHALRREVDEALAPKGIEYDKLKSALVPDRKRREIALVFDTTVIDNNWYGGEVAEQLFPLFDPRVNCSVLAGDYIDTGAGQNVLRQAMEESVQLRRSIDYRHSSQFYIIYINNLTDRMVESFTNGLANYPAYVGCAEMTYASPFKALLSTMLVNAFLKHGRTIIQSHEDDRPNTEDVNMYGYPAEQFGYVCRSVQSSLKGPLLSYKIERPVIPGFEADTMFALNAISGEPLALDDLVVQLDGRRLGYLRSQKRGMLEKANLEALDAEQLAALVQAKLSSSYLYNLSYDDRYDLAKFNTIIEVPAIEGRLPTRLLVALAYKPKDRALEVLTLY